mmetsp:Transcript_28411/g.67545  ORF Transcript_28411/g.67545 Transcript_28411/m.67545 type:complete len:240 (-) Transcript_28411:753-1472(-)
MDPEPASMIRAPRAAFGALEAVDQQGSPGLVHGEALSSILRISIRTLLGGQQRPFAALKIPKCDRGELVLHAITSTHIPATSFSSFHTSILGLGRLETLVALVLASAGGVEGCTQPLIEFLRLVRHLGVCATNATLLLQHLQEALVLRGPLGPLLKRLSILLLHVRLNISTRVNDGPAEDVDGRMDLPPLLPSAPLLILPLGFGLLPLLLGEPRVRRFGVPVRRVVVDLGPSLRVPVVA